MNAAFHRGIIDEQHLHVPLFASPAGPSKLQCVCGYQFCTQAELEKCSHDQLAVIVRNRRARHFHEVYKANDSGNPSNTSLHYNLHKAVQHTFDGNVSDEENTQRAIEYIVTVDKRGNVYAQDMENDVLVTVQSFRPFAAEWQRAMHGRKQLTLAAAINWELHKNL